MQEYEEHLIGLPGVQVALLLGKAAETGQTKKPLIPYGSNVAHEIVAFRRAARRFLIADPAAIASIVRFGGAWLEDAKTQALLQRWLDGFRATGAFFDPELEEYVASEADRNRLVELSEAAINALDDDKVNLPDNFVNDVPLRKNTVRATGAFGRSGAQNAIRDLLLRRTE